MNSSNCSSIVASLSGWSRSCRLALLLSLVFGPGVVFEPGVTRQACAEDPKPEPQFSSEHLDFFEKKIRPALVRHCYECHSVDAAKKNKLRGGLYLDSREGILEGGDSGPSAEPGVVDESLLLDALEYETLEMPPKGKLPEAVIADFREWVKIGLPDPRRRSSEPAKEKSIDLQAGRMHWAYQLPQRPEHPADKASQIDSLIEAALQRAEITPLGPASKSVLIRRLYFDLTGLPPSPAEVQDFLADDSSDAYERLVDRLLSSPHFGERWGRHWLDVVRYADSITLRGFVFKEAWRYRDYVIESFNNDLPFDQFIREQLAGDLIATKDVEQQRRQLIATTFLTLGNNNYEDQDKKKLDMDVVDEQLEAIGRGLLAQTIGCARCHDHKFDPIPTADYYALAGILRNTKTLEHSNVSRWD